MMIQKIIMIIAAVIFSSLILMAFAYTKSEVTAVSTNTLYGMVVDATTGEGISEAIVTLRETGQPDQTGEAGQAGESTIQEDVEIITQVASETTITDENGEFAFTEVEDGLYVISVEADLYRPAEEVVSVSEKEVSIEIELEPGI